MVINSRGEIKKKSSCKTHRYKEERGAGNDGAAAK